MTHGAKRITDTAESTAEERKEMKRMTDIAGERTENDRKGPKEEMMPTDSGEKEKRMTVSGKGE